MARGFGTNRGSATTDKITTALTAHSSTRTWFIWSRRRSETNANAQGIGAMWVKGGAVQYCESLLFYDAEANYRFSREFNGSGVCFWTFTKPSLNTWAAIGVSYDSSSTSNNPTIYVNGSSVTVSSPSPAPSGSATTQSDAYNIGNRADGASRAWDGDLYRFAVWDAILTAEEHAQLAAGVSPMLIRPDKLVEFVDMEDAIFSWVRSGLSSSGTAVQADPVGQIAHFSDIYALSTGAAGGTSKTVSITLVQGPADSTPAANLTGLKYAFFDAVTPDLFSAPTDKGTGETTDASGVLVVSVPNSTKTNGQTGFLIVTDSDGTTTQSPAHKAFAGPVTVTVS